MRNRITFSAYAAAWTAGAAASTETAAAFFFALRFLTDLRRAKRIELAYRDTSSVRHPAVESKLYIARAHT